jgi:flagellar basal-body rod modification protein FlgD
MTTISSTSLTQAAEQAAAANAASAAAGGSTSASGTASAASTTGANALQQLGSDFNQFLTLLTTQLQNQDPTSPMDSNAFTQELVEFTGVQQSVATNTNLSQLISLQQGSEVLQSANVVGHQVTVTANQIALQNGSGEITFNAPAAEPVQIAIVNSAGTPARDVSLTAQAGSNSWSWDGTDNQGNSLLDGAYAIAVETSAGGAATAVPFSVVGTATGLTNSSSGMQLQLGALSVSLANVQSLSAN